MKYRLLFLSALLLLVGCSGNEGAIAPEAPAAEEKENVTADETAEDSSAEEAEETASVDEANQSSEDSEEDIAGLDQKNVKLVVENQTTAGQIIVKTVATSRDGWVSIHKAQEDGGIQLPESIGEARVDSGDSENIIVDLWEAPDIGEKLWVLLHIDAGERGLYEFPGKDQAVRKDGKTMARSFIVEDPNPDKEEEEDPES